MITGTRGARYSRWRGPWSPGEGFTNLTISRHLLGQSDANLDAAPQNNDLALYERLCDLFRRLLETELEDALTQFQVKDLSTSRLARLSADFWSALSLHIELFLLHEPPDGEELVSLPGGEYRTAVEGQPVFTFRAPLSIREIASLIRTLGRPWVERYLAGYVLNKKILELFRQVSARQEVLLEWIETRDLRTLRRARSRLYQKLGSWSAPPETAPYPPGTIRERILSEEASSPLASKKNAKDSTGLMNTGYGFTPG
jgi:hypothetical protein